jgi:hypothetical protein
MTLVKKEAALVVRIRCATRVLWINGFNNHGLQRLGYCWLKVAMRMLFVDSMEDLDYIVLAYTSRLYLQNIS